MKITENEKNLSDGLYVGDKKVFDFTTGTPQTWEERFDYRFEGWVLKDDKEFTRSFYPIREFIAAEIKTAQEEVLDVIAKGEGWEESRNHYAKILGITISDKKE